MLQSDRLMDVPFVDTIQITAVLFVSTVIGHARLILFRLVRRPFRSVLTKPFGALQHMCVVAYHSTTNDIYVSIKFALFRN